MQSEPGRLGDIADAPVLAERQSEYVSPQSRLRVLTTAVTFYLEWAAREEKRPGVVLVHPTACFMFRLVPVEELIPDPSQRSNPFVRARAEEDSIVIAPINDSNDAENGGGSHWSLLVVDKRQRTATHYDSCVGHNLRVARETARCFDKLLGASLEFVQPSSVPQQTNGYDCGVHALMTFHRLYFAQPPPAPESAFRAHLLQLVLAEPRID